MEARHLASGGPGLEMSVYKSLGTSDTTAFRFVFLHARLG